MDGMISAEMGAIAPREVGTPHSDCPGRTMARQSLSKLRMSFWPCCSTTRNFGERVMTAGADFHDPKFLEAFVICNTHQLAMAGKLLFPIPERSLGDRLLG